MIRSEVEQCLLRAEELAPLRPLEALAYVDRAGQLAMEAGDPVLISRTLMAQALPFRPQVRPLRAAQACVQAESTLRALGRDSEAMTARARGVMALSDAGEDWQALRIAAGLLRDRRLGVAEKLMASLAVAASELHLGRISRAWDALVGIAEPSAIALARPAALARVNHLQAQVLIAAAWGGPDSEPWAGLFPEIAGSTSLRLAQQAGRYIESAIEFSPDLAASGHLRLTQALADATFHPDSQSEIAIDEILAAAKDRDPPLVVHALFGKLWLQRRRELNVLAFETCRQLEALIEAGDQVGLRRDLLLVQSRLHEANGDATAALSALRKHARLLSSAFGQGSAPESSPWHEGSRDKAVRPRRTVSPGFVVRAVRYIDEARHLPLRVADIARHVEVSRRTLESAFVEHRGLTVAAYVTTVGMRRAAERMRHTNLPLATIAQDAGYRSVAAFSRAFKLHFGAPPTTWLRLQAGESAD